MMSRKRAELVIAEATGKRIRQLVLAEPYAGSHDLYLTVECDDETEILIELNCSLFFAVTPLLKNKHGDLTPAGKTRKGSIHSLVKAHMRRESARR